MKYRYRSNPDFKPNLNDHSIKISFKNTDLDIIKHPESSIPQKSMEKPKNSFMVPKSTTSLAKSGDKEVFKRRALRAKVTKLLEEVKAEEEYVRLTISYFFCGKVSEKKNNFNFEKFPLSCIFPCHFLKVFL